MTTLLLTDVLKTIHDLPSLPTLVLELLASMEQADVEIGTLARKISLDQALTARTLRVANSSFYGMQRQVTTIGEAIAILGFHSVRNLVVTAALMDGLGNKDDTFDFIAFWRHAIGSALCARAIAARLQLNQEQAYTAGLLHDIGRLVLATRFPKHHAAVAVHRARNDCFMVEAERAVLGLEHAMVGEALARHWKFPDLMQQAVAQHHSPELAGVQSLPLVVHVADAVAHALDFSRDDDDLVPAVTEHIWQRLGMDQKMLAGVLEDAELQFEAACSVLAP